MRRDLLDWLRVRGERHPQEADSESGEEQGGTTLEVRRAPKTRPASSTMAMVTEAVL